MQSVKMASPVEEKLCEIMLSEALSDSEKLDQLHALIPADACKIDNLNKATPAQLKHLKDVSSYPSDATNQACRTTGKRKRAIPLKTSATQGDVGGFDEGRDAVACLKPNVLH